MVLDPDRVGAVTLDCFGTLLDDRSAAGALEGLVADPEAVAGRWHSLAVRYSLAATVLGTDRTYTELHHDALATLLSERDGLADADVEAVTRAYRDLDPFADTADALARLAGAYPVAVVTNGDPPMLDGLLDRFGDHVDLVVSADELGTFKPDAALYERAAARLGVPSRRIVHATAGWLDVQGALHAGLRAAWVNRRDRARPGFGTDPDLTAGSLAAVADALAVA
ncbi:MAG: HAD-IA family hydrolase [Halobacteriales archaeon]